MSFKEFLGDYAMKEEEAVRRYVQEFANGRVPEDTTYPPASRFPSAKLPYALPRACNVWEVIPFHGSSMLTLPCVDNVRLFDQIQSTYGVSSRGIQDCMDFARETGRMVFGLTGRATLYDKLEFLEPLFHELRPPQPAALPMDVVMDGSVAKAEHAAFLDLAKPRFVAEVAAFMQATGGGGTELLEQRLSNFGYIYAFLRRCGYEGLAAAVEADMATDCERAFQTLGFLNELLVAPTLSSTGGPRVLGAPLIDAIRGNPDLGVLTAQRPGEARHRYDVGRFVLSKIVAYPETEDGCRRIIQEYEAAGLGRVRSDFYKAIRAEDPGAFSDGADAISRVCSQVWEKVDRIGLLEKAGALAPSLTVGVVGALATVNPLVGIASAAAGGIADKALGGPASRVVKHGIGRVLGMSHLISIYDFKGSMPKRHPN